MSSLTLDQAKKIHALALLFNALDWWTIEYEKKMLNAEDFQKREYPLPFGLYNTPAIKGWGNWYDFSTKEIAENFRAVLKEMNIESSYSDNYFFHTVFINW